MSSISCGEIPTHQFGGSIFAIAGIAGLGPRCMLACARATFNKPKATPIRTNNPQGRPAKHGIGSFSAKRNPLEDHPQAEFDLPVRVGQRVCNLTKCGVRTRYQLPRRVDVPVGEGSIWLPKVRGVCEVVKLSAELNPDSVLRHREVFENR